MPLDGTELGVIENKTLTKLGEVERLLINEQQWCKGRLRDQDGRYCLVGAMQAVEARQILEPIILRAAREVGGKRYWRIESFNDNRHTTHADILRVLRRARENIIADMIEGTPHPRYKRWLQALRIWRSERRTAISTPLRLATGKTPPGADMSAAPIIRAQNDKPSPAILAIREMSR
jgi:hypothetical protein